MVTWRALFDRAADRAVTAEEVQAALAARRDDREQGNGAEHGSDGADAPTEDTGGDHGRS
ncbi:MAG: hypothetical protein ABEH78_04850 [Haloferacaceae archaeon]